MTPEPRVPHSAMLNRSMAVGICVLPGWEESRAASAEVGVARALGLPVAYLCDSDRDGVRRDMQWGKVLSETVLEEADRLVANDRQVAHGHPLDNVTQTGRIWGSLLDIAEYAKCGDLVLAERTRRAMTR